MKSMQLTFRILLLEDVIYTFEKKITKYGQLEQIVEYKKQVNGAYAVKKAPTNLKVTFTPVLQLNEG
jgi:hypothetical protein